MPTLLIHDATLIDGTGTDPRPGVSVRVEDGRITRIAPNDAFEGSDGTVIDAGGRYLLLGLTDAHLHLGLTEGNGGAPSAPAEAEPVTGGDTPAEGEAEAPSEETTA